MSIKHNSAGMHIELVYIISADFYFRIFVLFYYALNVISCVSESSIN